ncbi:MAG: hypothetical protein Q9164_004222 [Protoblastenia rupestris]
MAEAPLIFTVDGQPPNGAIPPGLLLMRMPDAPIVRQVPALPVSPDVPQIENAAHRAPKAATTVYAPGTTHHHTHYHIHEAAPANNAVAAAAAPAPIEQSTYIHWVNNGVRPCDYYPEACPNVQYSRHTIPKNTTINQLMAFFGCPAVRGRGLQQIFRMEGDVYGAGQQWEYGVGDQNMTLGECEIGRGVLGRETLLVVWTAGQ